MIDLFPSTIPGIIQISFNDDLSMRAATPIIERSLTLVGSILVQVNLINDRVSCPEGQESVESSPL